MFEFVTKYDKEKTFKCLKVYCKKVAKYNPTIYMILIILCIVLATISLYLGIVNPETYKTTFAAIFFYVMAFIFILGNIVCSDKYLRKKVDKMFTNNPSLYTEVKYIFNDNNFITISNQNEKEYNYNMIIHLDKIDDYIVIIFGKMKFIALKENEDLYEFLKYKIKK